MLQIQLHKCINQIITFLYGVKFWSRSDEGSVLKWTLKTFYSALYLLMPISIFAGAIINDNKDEQIFLLEMILITTVQYSKFMFLILNETKFLELLNRICIYAIHDHKTFTFVNKKMGVFMKFTAIFVCLLFFNMVISSSVIPFLGSERTLFFKIGFPLDYENDEIAFWIAYIFMFIEITFSAMPILISVITWYLMFHCGLRFMVLGTKIKAMGAIEPAKETWKNRTNASRDNLFRLTLHEAITEHQILIESTQLLNVLLSKVFAAQLATSGLCICASVYRLAFNKENNFFEAAFHLIVFFYNIFEIYMVSHMGDEIKTACGKLHYNLFESEWMDRSESIKKEILIFGEFLMKPVELVILKLYPLTLETFSRVINSAYSMFNILKNSIQA